MWKGSEGATTNRDLEKPHLMLAILILLNGIWLAFAAGTDMLISNSATGQHLFSPVRRLFGAICHQQFDRSFELLGFPMYLCARCTGIFSGMLVGLMLIPLMKPLASVYRRWSNWILYAMIAINLLSVSVELVFSHEWTNLSRLAMGLGLGLSIPLLFIDHFIKHK